jgi:hypothetical protein
MGWENLKITEKSMLFFLQIHVIIYKRAFGGNLHKRVGKIWSCIISGQWAKIGSNGLHIGLVGQLKEGIQVPSFLDTERGRDRGTLAKRSSHFSRA